MTVLFVFLHYPKENLDQDFIGGFNLSVPLGMLRSCKFMVSLEALTQFSHFRVLETKAIVRKFCPRNAKMKNNSMKDIPWNSHTCCGCQGHGFYTLGEVFHSFDDEFVAVSQARVYLSYQVQTSCRKMPRGFNWMKFLGWCMMYGGIQLAWCTPFDVFMNILPHDGPSVSF